MKISLITVAYNSAKTIADTINSIRTQSYPDIEYVIIDGASSDETLQLINSSDYPGIVLISEPDGGIYDAMNKGVEMATGEVVGILNSDDVYQDSEVIKEVMTYFISDPDLDILYGDLVYVKSDDLSKVVRKWRSRQTYPKFFEHANVPPHPTLFLKKKVYTQVGRFDLRYKLAADYEFMLRVFKKFDFKSRYVSRLMVKMRLGGATNKSFKNIWNGNKEIILAWRNNGFRVPVFLMPLRFIKRIIQFI